jgi:hypothetical protein
MKCRATAWSARALILSLSLTCAGCTIPGALEFLSKGYRTSYNGSDFFIDLWADEVRQLGGPDSKAVKARLDAIVDVEGWCKPRPYEWSKAYPPIPYKGLWGFRGYCIGKPPPS